MIHQSHSWAYTQKKTLIWKDTCTPMFIAALFTIGRPWKQPKCPSTDEWIKKNVIHTDSGILLRHKKEWNNAICSNMEGLRPYHTKWNKSERERHVPYDDFPGGSDGKVSVYNVGELSSIPGSGRSAGEGNGNPLQYYCLENPMDRGTW